MTENIITLNLQVMKKFMWPTPFKQFAEMLKNIPHNVLQVEENGTSCPSLLFNTPNGKIRINSGREPEKEAERQIDQWLTDHPSASSSLIIIIGCTGLAHLRQMAIKLQPGGHIFVLELHPEIFCNILQTCDLSPLLTYSPGTFHFAIDPDFNQIVNNLREQLRRNQSGKFVIYAPPGLERLFREEYRQIREQIDTLLTIERQNRNTEAIYASTWLNNAMLNLSRIATGPEIGCLRGKFAGTTAIVAAAGPGLNSMLPWIKSVADKYVIIAVGTSLRSLVNAGIEPDFVLAVDSSTEIIPQFEGFTTSHTWLVGAHILHPEIFKFFPGRSLLFTADVLPGVNLWLEKIGIIPERLRVGGTVSLSAIDFAFHLGCSQLVLAGLDLAFAENGDTHAKGTIYEKSRITSGAWLSVPGNHGKTVKSSRQFISYIKMIESYLAQQLGQSPELKIYNANSSGAAIAGTEAIDPLKLKEIEFHSVQNEKYEYIFNSVNIAEVKVPLTELYRQFGMMQQEMLQIAGQSAIALAALDDYEQSEDKIVPPELFTLLDIIDARLKECSSAALMLEGIIKVLHAKNNGLGSDINTLLRQNKEIYRCLHEQAVHAANELERTSARMQR